jgi:hypothetical protein
MTTLSNTSKKELGKLFSSLFSENVVTCTCGRVLSVDGKWGYPMTVEERERIRKAGRTEYCPECMKRMVYAA